MRKAHTAAFTLIELLIVVAIIGILAAIAVPNFLGAQLRAKVARVNAELRGLSTAIEAYRSDNGAYIPWQLTPEIQQRFGRWGSMLMLTTPIAYLNSVPGDDFHPVNIQATGEENPIDREFPYAYWNAKELGQASGVSGVDWFCVDMYERGTYYMLASIGPDRVWQAQDVSLPFVGNKSYSSSNGINSKGDIFRFGP